MHEPQLHADPGIAALLLSMLSAILKALGTAIPGILGSLVALRFLPAGATWIDRLAAFGGGYGCAVFIGPAIFGWTGLASPEIGKGIEFVLGLFGMAAVGELLRAMREVGFAGLLRALVDRISAMIGGGRP